VDDLKNLQHYDKAIIFAYPRNAGGKFLINSLGLSPKFALQCSILATAQLSNIITPRQKHQLLIDRLDEVGDTWDDLRLGNLFGHEFNRLLKNTPEKLTAVPSILSQLMHQDFYIPIIAHTVEELAVLKRFLVYAQVIEFVNTKPFMINRTMKSIEEYWQVVRGEQWPSQPPTSIDEIKSLPNFIQEELRTHFKNEIYEYFTPNDIEAGMTSFLNGNSIKWDCTNYFLENNCVSNIKLLYDQLNLDCWDHDNISSYYRKWTAVLDHIKNKTLSKMVA
jgi:hypothetical protein